MKRSVLLDLYTAFQKADQVIDVVVDGVGISGEDYAFLSLIGPREVTPTELARESGHSLSTVLFRANRNVDLGFVERVANPRDGRSFHLRLTAKGRRAWERAGVRLWKMIEQIEERLDRPADEVHAAIRALEAAMDAVLADGRPLPRR